MEGFLRSVMLEIPAGKRWKLRTVGGLAASVKIALIQYTETRKEKKEDKSDGQPLLPTALADVYPLIHTRNGQLV